MIKFIDILESYWDDPYHDEGEEYYGFKDSDLDDIKIHFKQIASYDMYSLLFDTETNFYYISVTEDIDDAYRQGYFTQEVDADEDGKYSYWQFNDDSAEITDESISLFTQEEVKENRVTSDVENFVDGNTSELVLVITKENIELVYENFSELIKEYFYESRKKKK